MNDTHIKTEVKKRYARVAQTDGGCCGGDQSCCGGSANTVQLIDYGDLAAQTAEGANLGLGCGIPTRSAGIQPGETVLDLGSGAGMDVFIAARVVGPQGRVIGVDMTPEMIQRAEINAVLGGYDNVEFRLGDIEALPVDDGSVDVVISNCVINLAPDKRRAFAEVYRALKPGGRFSISDIVTHGDVPQSVRQDMDLWAGCIAGALDRDEYLQIIREAGFDDVRVEQTTEYDDGATPEYSFASITVVGRKR